MSTALGRKCDELVTGIDSALAENARTMAGLCGAEKNGIAADLDEIAALSPHYDQLASEIRGVLSLPDPPGTTRLDIIRTELEKAREPRRIF